jgi:fused signal recognition particle receptor
MAETWMGRLRAGLARAREGLLGRIAAAVAGRRLLDAATLEELEGILLAADVGLAETERLVGRLREAAARERLRPEEVPERLRAEVAAALRGAARPLRLAPEPPTVVLIVGVNGTGKTTTVGKLAHRLRAEGRRVLLGAADTFRAAAAEQLQVWADRAGVDMVRHAPGGDPAAVVFDAISAGRARGADVVLCDTAGRLHNKAGLMAELQKMVRVAGRACPGAPHEVLLVLDASTGQNALAQARVFTEAASVTGLVLTKLDTTARGGIVLAVHRELGLPILYVGVGEGPEDLRPFDPEAFAAALLGPEGAA